MSSSMLCNKIQILAALVYVCLDIELNSNSMLKIAMAYNDISNDNLQ